MKYGYLFYKKPLISEMPSRPINLGDPIQSYAVKLLYKEMGIPDSDIIPIPRYDMKYYDGEECICVINTCSTYEELAYDSDFMPPSSKIHAIPFSLHINRDIPEDELEFYFSCDSVGCRDSFTENELAKKGINAYLTGCLTLTFPRRSIEETKTAKNVYLIDVQPDFKRLIPTELLVGAKELSSIYRFQIRSASNRMSDQEAYDFHKMGEDRIDLLKKDARLVITSRLHVASPCLAMGIPVILTKHDDRFGFIDRFLPAYTSWATDCIDWNPKAIDIEREKNIIKRAFFNRIRCEEARIEMKTMWKEKQKNSPYLDYVPQVKTALQSINLCMTNIRYAVLGVVSSVSYFIPVYMNELFPDSELVCGIDSYVKQNFCGVPTVNITNISRLDKDIVIITAVPAAYKAALPLLESRPCIFIHGKKADSKNID